MNHHFWSKNLRKILVISIGVQVLCVVIFLCTFTRIQEVIEQNIVQFTERYVEKAADELNRNNVYMSATTVTNQEYRVMFEKSDLELVNRISELQTTYRLLSSVEEYKYNFFIMNKDTGKFIELTAVKIPFSQYREIKTDICDQVDRKAENGKWCLIEAGGERIIISTWTYGNFAIGSWISEAAFLAEVSDLDCGTGGGAKLLLKQENMEQKTQRGLGGSVLFYHLEDVGTNFTIQFTISRNAEMKRLMMIQLLQFAFAIQVLVVLLFMVRQVKKKLIIPVNNLMEVLGKYQFEMSSQKPEEELDQLSVFHDAYQILDKLGQRLENLSLELYKSELEKKQLQISFRNLQIRPHFFVNCLAMISGMAQLKDVDRIQAMTICLSEYYRYVLHDCMDMIRLQQEVHHMENVIRVNNEWNSNTLKFEWQFGNDVGNMYIPVLSVSTFLENSIKHAVIEQGILLISLYACIKQERYLSVKIIDNGEGFSDENLKQFNSGKFVGETQGKHIGINNVLQRLDLIYGGKARVIFSNEEQGGACVEILIPIGVEQRNETFDCRR